MPVYVNEDFEPVAPFIFDPTGGCPDDGEDLYDTGCDAAGHHGYGCVDCGWGCDYDLVPDDESECVAAGATSTTD